AFWRCCFFFASRRRHTRLVSDWSSDVCSSDLFHQRVLRVEDHQIHALIEREVRPELVTRHARAFRVHAVRVGAAALLELVTPARSEERRVGKEGGSRRSAAHEKEKGERGGGKT